jgi:hypothetical protein
MSYDVFVSHCMAAEDEPIVAALTARLDGQGIVAYLAERDPQPGRPLSSKILERIRRCDLVAVLWTKGGSSSEWVNQEIGAARSAGKPVVPIVERGVRVKGLLEGIEHVEFDRDNPDGALESLEAFLTNKRDAKDAAAREAEREAERMKELVLFGIGAALVIALVIVLALAARES